jgi:hypothetical protein
MPPTRLKRRFLLSLSAIESAPGFAVAFRTSLPYEIRVCWLRSARASLSIAERYPLVAISLALPDYDLITVETDIAHP